MLCPKCHTQVQPDARFCPSCGEKLEGKPPSRFSWMILLAGALPVLAILAYFLFFNVNLTDIAETELKAIRTNKLQDAYYKYTTKDFQQTNTFDSFKEFVQTTPILQNFTDLTFGKQSLDGDTGTIKAIIEKSDSGAEVFFNLSREERKWKISGLTVAEFQKNTSSDNASTTTELIAPIDAQLKALKENDPSAAYVNLVSKDFKKETPFDKFKAFVMEYPLLSKFLRYDYKEHYLTKDRGVATVILNPESDALPIEYRLIQEDGKWKILFMRLLLPNKNVSIGGKLDTLSMISTVEQAMETIRDKDFERAYYKFLSKKLQQETPLDTFRKFSEQYPILTNYTSLNVKEPYLEEEIGRVTLELQNNNQSTEVEFALEDQQGEWKIIGMHIENLPEETTTVKQNDNKNFKSRDLINAIQAFLAALRANENARAYTQLTATHFQEENSSKDFEEFLTKHPELSKTTSASFEKLMFNNNIATFAVVLFLSETKVLPAEFDLIQEDGKWKILNIIVYPAKDLPPGGAKSTTEEKEDGTEFDKAVLGTKIDDEGVITQPTTTFSKETGDIYLNLYIKNGSAGKHFEVSLRHVDSGSSIPPVHATVVEDGDSMADFVFSPPPKGWPVGSYQVKVSSGNTKFKTFAFKVE